MVDDVLGSALTYRRFHRVQHQLRPQVVCHRPADDLAAPGVQHDSKIQETGSRRHIRDVGNPKLIWSRRREVAIHQVRRRSSILVAPGRRWPAMPVAGAHQPGPAHQPRDPFAAVSLTSAPQIGVNAWRAIGLARAGVHGPNPFQQRSVGHRVVGRRSLPPSVETSLGHAEHARHGGNREAGLVRAHEPEEPDDTAPVSRANQAAAFDKISRSTRSCLFSRRSRANSSRSAALRPGSTSSRQPSCRPA